MLIEQFKPVVKKFNPAESAKTLRKLGLFGCSNNGVDFEWTKKDEAEAFKADDLIKLLSFNWKEK